MNNSKLAERRHAVSWYYEVNDFCQSLSEIYDVPLIKVAGIMSALSPNNTFASNCKSLEKFLKHKTDCKVSTFNGQKNKAKEIYFMENPTEEKIKAVLSGLKTLSFFENIYRPKTSKAVTIDLWMIRWAKSLKLIPEKGSLTPKRYRMLSDMVTKVANDLQLRPLEYQALLWVEQRGEIY